MAMTRKQRKAGEYAKDLFLSAKDHSDMSVVRDEWDKSDKLVEGIRPNAPPPNVWIPSTYSTLRAELSTIVLSTFSEDQGPPFVFKPPDSIPSGLSPDDAVMQAELDTAFAGNQMRKMNAFVLYRNWFSDALRYGTGIIKFAWRRVTETEFEEVPVLDPVTGQPIPGVDGQPLTRPEPKEVVLENGPQIENIDIRNFFIDWDFNDIEDMVFVAHRKVISREELARRGKNGTYKNVDIILDNKGEAFKRDIEEHSQILRSMRGLGGQDSPKVDEDSPFFKKHAKVEIVEIQRDDEFITIALSPGFALLRQIDNPFNHGQKTYLAVRNIIRPKMFYGISEPMLMESLQNEENYIHNTALKNMNLAINKTFVADRNADIDLDRLKSRPGGVILSNDVDAVKQLDVNEVGLNGFTILKGAIEAAKEDATSVTRTFKGATPTRGETATTTAALLGQASSAIKFKYKEWFHEGIVPFAQMLQSLNRQFMDFEQVIKIQDQLGQDTWASYKASSVEVEFPVYPVSSLEDVFGDKQLRQANILRFTQIMGSNPVFAQYMKPWGFLLETAKSLDYRNIKSILFTPQELQQIRDFQNQTGQTPPGAPDLQLLQGGSGGQSDFGQGQRPQNSPSPSSSQSLQRSTSARGAQPGT